MHHVKVKTQCKEEKHIPLTVVTWNTCKDDRDSGHTRPVIAEGHHKLAPKQIKSCHKAHGIQDGHNYHVTKITDALFVKTARPNQLIWEPIKCVDTAHKPGWQETAAKRLARSSRRQEEESGSRKQCAAL